MGRSQYKDTVLQIKNDLTVITKHDDLRISLADIIIHIRSMAAIS